MLHPTLDEPEQAQPEAAPAAQAPAQPKRSSRRVQASPVAKRLAKELGIDLSQVVGTGRDGLIGKEDVLAFQEQSGGAPAAAGPAVASEIKLSGIKKIVAERMKASYLDAPHIALSMACNMAAASSLRAELNDGLQGEGKITFTDMLVKAVAEALKAHTLLNSQFQEDKVLVFGEVNVGVAVASDDGLVVPVIKNADQLSLAEISKALGELASRVRSGKQSMEDLSGGTFTISNLGMYEIDFFKPIINPGQAAILGVGAIKNEPVVQDDGSVAAQPTMMMTLSCDHRIVDGVDGAEFLRTLKHNLENPAFMVEG
jgi:pyruvate dehydrogenase E2 component (dihydrolipoamide acetyltransferase)